MISSKFVYNILHHIDSVGDTGSDVGSYSSLCFQTVTTALDVPSVSSYPTVVVSIHERLW